jgi:DNA-binding NarL/FixJ family response regulator
MLSSVIIAEHSEIIRKGMAEILGKSGLFDRVREVACAANLMDLVNRYHPDVLVVNPGMVDNHFRDQLKNGKGYRPRLAAIVYSFHDEAVLEVFDELIQINDTRAKIQKKLIALVNTTPAEPIETDHGLSPRETDVLKELVRGLSNKEISEKLFISTHTVMSHRKNITQKLNIKSVAGLTVYAILNKIIRMEDLRQE